MDSMSRSLDIIPEAKPLPLNPNKATGKTNHGYSSDYLYQECLKNHAASLGRHALDGCGEFIYSPSSDPFDPSSLTCASCGCHRNFHRRVVDYDEEHEDGSHVLLTLRTGGPRCEKFGNVLIRRKRSRTRFTTEQKEGMLELAQKVGWRFQRRNEHVVVDGCRQIGVEKGAFKVWVHNHKQAILGSRKWETMGNGSDENRCNENNDNSNNNDDEGNKNDDESNNNDDEGNNNDDEGKKHMMNGSSPCT